MVDKHAGLRSRDTTSNLLLTSHTASSTHKHTHIPAKSNPKVLTAIHDFSQGDQCASLAVEDNACLPSPRCATNNARITVIVRPTSQTSMMLGQGTPLKHKRVLPRLERRL